MVLSIIMCSRTQTIKKELSENIQKTIGCEYELIVIDNSHNDKSIFEAYRQGEQQSTGEYLCFVHDDVEFISENWGIIVSDYFKQHPKCGCLGIAGGHVLPQCVSGWSICGICSTNILQGYCENGCQEYKINKQDSLKRDPTIVAALDVVFLCFPKKIFHTIEWDTKNYAGYHFYDMDICMQINSSNFECHINWDILLKHRSPGFADKNFKKMGEIWYKKWSKYLPLVKGVELDFQIIEALNNYAKLQQYYSELQHSKQYRIGKIILAPFTLLHKIINRITKCN